MSVIDELVQLNHANADGHVGSLPSAPVKQLVVVTCMDARLDVHRVLGLVEGDAHVVRNAGAAVTDDVIRSLAVSQRLLGTRDTMVISHTDCRMRSFSDAGFRAQLEQETGEPPPWRPEEFRDPDADVRESVARIRDSPFVPHRDRVRGFVLDLADGRLREVTDA